MLDAGDDWVLVTGWMSYWFLVSGCWLLVAGELCSACSGLRGGSFLQMGTFDGLDEKVQLFAKCLEPGRNPFEKTGVFQ
jgi:hypothetical protein